MFNNSLRKALIKFIHSIIFHTILQYFLIQIKKLEDNFIINVANLV